MELNRDQIIKALECCIDVNCGSIAVCPRRENHRNEYECQANLKKDALALIKELTEENAKLAHSCTKLETLYKIESKRVDTVKADTVRKMQERLKAEAGYFGRAVAVDVIDQIANELLEKS